MSSSPQPDVDFDALIGKLDLETKIRLLSGAGPDDGGRSRDRPAVDDRLGRPCRCARGDRHRAGAFVRAAHRFGDGRHLGRGPARADRWTAGRRGRAQGRRRRPRADHQPAPLAGGRPALRVLLRGPVPDRPAGHGLRPRTAGAGGRRLPEALRRQRRRDRPHVGRQPRRRADPARALPRALRGRGRRRRSRGRSWRPTTASTVPR